MISIDNNTHLLEIDPYDYTLQNVEEPNLFREIFSYDRIPTIPFNHRKVPENMPKDIYITDTTFRDGQQSIEPYTVDQIVHIYKLLSRLGGPNGVIRQTEFFVYSKKDQEALDKCLQTGCKFPEVTAWIRANKKDYELVRDIGIKETGILMSCSDYHIFNKLKMNRQQAADLYLSIVYDVINAGLKPRCHLEDITRADLYGFVIPFVNMLRRVSEETGVPIKIRACDTLGYGIPHSGVATPRSVPGIIYGLQHYGKMPSELLEWHGHNDFYKAVANASAAWLYGASAVNCSLFGIGERTGNIPLEAMVFEYAGYKGTLNGMDTTAITELARYYEREIGLKIPENTPFVGKHFNVTKAGIHADGLLKDEEIYNIFDTRKFLNRPPLVSLGSNSGLSGVAYWFNGFFGIPAQKAVSKNDPMLQKIKTFIDEQYASGRVSDISDKEICDFIKGCPDIMAFLDENGISL